VYSFPYCSPFLVMYYTSFVLHFLRSFRISYSPYAGSLVSLPSLAVSCFLFGWLVALSFGRSLIVTIISGLHVYKQSWDLPAKYRTFPHVFSSLLRIDLETPCLAASLSRRSSPFFLSHLASGPMTASFPFYSCTVKAADYVLSVTLPLIPKRRFP
jgi:hypothetical protein